MYLKKPKQCFKNIHHYCFSTDLFVIIKIYLYFIRCNTLEKIIGLKIHFTSKYINSYQTFNFNDIVKPKNFFKKRILHYFSHLDKQVWTIELKERYFLFKVKMEKKRWILFMRVPHKTIEKNKRKRKWAKKECENRK